MHPIDSVQKCIFWGNKCQSNNHSFSSSQTLNWTYTALRCPMLYLTLALTTHRTRNIYDGISYHALKILILQSTVHTKLFALRLWCSCRPLGAIPEHWSAAMRYELYACSITLKITWIFSSKKKKHFLCFDFLLATIKQTEKWQLPTRLWGCLFCSLAYFSKSTRNRMEQIQSANICLCGECASLRVTEN